MVEVQKVLNEFAIKLIDTYKDKLEDSIASGNLIDTMSFEVVYNDNKYEILLSLEDYWYYIENGREPGTYPNIDAIRQWLTIKQILPEPYQLPNGEFRLPTEDQLVYLISNKIYEEGIEPKHYLADSINELLDDLYSNIKIAFIKDINDEVITILKDLGE